MLLQDGLKQNLSDCELLVLTYKFKISNVNASFIGILSFSSLC